VLTLPFLFAAAVQALVRSDLALLIRATLGYLPLAMLMVSVAAPLTTLLLAASDQLSAVVSAAAGNASGRFLDRAGATIGLLTALSGSPFLAFFVGIMTIGGAFLLWVELLMREAAVYVIVLMLPLAFAALVWPARRIWATRTLELLVALILSKFAIVAVLSLGAAALTGSIGHGISGALAGFVLLVLGALAPWALLRLLPLAELGSEAAGSLRGEWQAAQARRQTVEARLKGWATDAAASTPVQMLRELDMPSPIASQTASHAVGSQPVASAAVGSGAAGSGANGAGSSRPVDDGSEPLTEAAERSSNAPAASGAQGSSPRVGANGAPSDDAGSAAPHHGLDPMWQAPDLSWRPLTLGLGDGWPPPSLWPPGDSDTDDPPRTGPDSKPPPKPR
jgi:hypothetical protein